MTPRAVGRPQVPPGYGVEAGGEYLAWETVEDKLRQSLHFWMATTRPDGRPHVVPRWGVWVDEAFWYDGSPQTRHALNAVHNPSCTLHLEDGAAAVIIEGTTATSMPIEGEMGDRLAAEFERKYGVLGYSPESDAWSGADAGGLMRFRPLSAIAWSRFPEDLTKFLFD